MSKTINLQEMTWSDASSKQSRFSINMYAHLRKEFWQKAKDTTKDVAKLTIREVKAHKAKDST